MVNHQCSAVHLFIQKEKAEKLNNNVCTIFLIFVSVCFYSQGMITIVLECIDRLNVYNTAAHFSEFAGEEAAESWKEIVNLLYELLGKRFTVKSVYRLQDNKIKYDIYWMK